MAFTESDDNQIMSEKERFEGSNNIRDGADGGYWLVRPQRGALLPLLISFSHPEAKRVTGLGEDKSWREKEVGGMLHVSW